MPTLSRHSSRHPLLQPEDTSSLTSFPDPATPSQETLSGPEPLPSPVNESHNHVLDSLLDGHSTTFFENGAAANSLTEPQTLSTAPSHILQSIIDRDGAIPLVRRLSRLLAERDAHVTALTRLAEEYKVPRQSIVETTSRVKRSEERRLALHVAAEEDIAPLKRSSSASSNAIAASAATTTLTRIFGGTIRGARSASRTPAVKQERQSLSDAQSVKSVQSAQTVQSTDSIGWTAGLFGASRGKRHDSGASREPVEMIPQIDKDELPPTLTDRRDDPHEAAWNKFLLNITKARSRDGKQDQADDGGGLIGPLVGQQKLKALGQLVMAGIPMQLRQYIWLELSHADSLKEPSAYESYIREEVDPAEIDAIVNDVPRTLTQSRSFYTNKGFERLKEVLVAFVAKYDNLGYTQGLNSIAGYLLLAIPQNEEAFWMLCKMVDEYFPEEYFARENAMTGPLADVIVLRSYVRELMPQLAKHMDDLDIGPQHTVPVRWFFTAFSNVLGEDALMRVWDIWLCLPGQKTFLFNVALALLMQNASGLLACETEGEYWSYMDDKDQCKVDGDAEWVNKLIKAAVELRKELQKVGERRAWEAKLLRRKVGSCEALYSPDEMRPGSGGHAPDNGR